jgi:hypothetical protein
VGSRGTLSTDWGVDGETSGSIGDNAGLHGVQRAQLH